MCTENPPNSLNLFWIHRLKLEGGANDMAGDNFVNPAQVGSVAENKVILEFRV